MKLFGVYGINQFQLEYETEEEAIAEATRLSIKYEGRYFSVGTVIRVFENGQEIMDLRNGNGFNVTES